MGHGSGACLASAGKNIIAVQNDPLDKNCLRTAGLHPPVVPGIGHRSG